MRVAYYFRHSGVIALLYIAFNLVKLPYDRTAKKRLYLNGHITIMVSSSGVGVTFTLIHVSSFPQMPMNVTTV